MKTRRRFIIESSATWLTAAASPVLLISCDDHGEERVPELEELQQSNIELFPGVPLSSTKARAVGLLNSRFNILYDDASLIEAELVEVNSGLRTSDTDEFTFLFRTTWEPALDEATYDFEHAELGRFPLYVKPADRSDNAYYYSVSVNHLLSIP